MVTNADRDLRLGEKRATSILAAIDTTRTLTLGQLLGSLGLEHLGKRRVELMMLSANGALDAMTDWRSGQLRDADFAAAAGVPKIGGAIQDGIDAMATVIDKLLAAGVTVLPQQRDLADPNATPARTVCISGKLPSGRKKADYEESLRSAGYALVDDVVKGLDYLVLADPDSTSSKAEKAKKLGIPVISEEQLLALSGAALSDQIPIPILIPDASTHPTRKIAVQPASITNMDQKMTNKIANEIASSIPDSESRYFEFIDEKSSKFWEVRVAGSNVDVCYGKIGTAGQKQSKPFSDGAAASKQAEKLIAEKVGKGYHAAVKQVNQDAGDVPDMKKIIGQEKLKISPSTIEKLRLDKKQNLVGRYSKILDLREHAFDAEVFIHLESEFKKAEKKGQLPQSNIRLADDADVEVIYFPNDQFGFYYAVLENLPNLRELYICGDESSSSVNMDGELKWLICKNLPNLKKIKIEGGVKWLQIEDAQKLESIDASQSRMLEHFSMKNVPLLNNVIVKNCKKLPDIDGIDNAMKELLGVSEQINSIQKKSKGNGKIYADMTFSDVDMVLANINKGVELAAKKRILIDENNYEDPEDDEIDDIDENREDAEISYMNFHIELLRPLENVYTGGTAQTYFYCFLSCSSGACSGEGQSSQEACLHAALRSLLSCYESNIPGLSAPSAEELLDFLTKLVAKESRPAKVPAVSVKVAPPPKAIAVAGASPAKTVCISGKLPSGRKKADYEEALRSAGYALVDDVVKGLDYLVLADPDSTSSKAEKAKKLGIPVISEEQLQALSSGSAADPA
jgi:predicted DNA-binding WGR domain protein